MPYLLGICLVFPGIYAIRRSCFRGGVEINHVTLFTLGFLSYWIFPIGVATLLSSQLGSTLGADLMDLYAGARSTAEYLVLCGIIYLGFVAGDLLARSLKTPPLRRLKQINETVLFQFGCLAALIAAGAMFHARDILLKGSYIADPNPYERGTVAASCVFLFMVGMIHIVQASPSTPKGMLLNRYMLLFWPANLILFLSGSRLYFISFLLMLVVYWTNFKARLRVTRILALLFSSLFVVGAIGAYRLGGGSAQNIIANLIEEPMFTSFSLAAFLNWNRFHLWNVPTYLLSDLVDLIPSAVFPGKLSLMVQMPDVYAPLGALNSFVSFQWNFGVLGTVSFMFLLGYSMERLRRRCELWSRVSYVLISGWLTFTFFRDPFSISLVKNILEFSILLPGVIILLTRWIAYAAGDQPLTARGSNEVGILTR